MPQQAAPSLSTQIGRYGLVTSNPTVEDLNRDDTRCVFLRGCVDRLPNFFCRNRMPSEAPSYTQHVPLIPANIHPNRLPSQPPPATIPIYCPPPPATSSSTLAPTAVSQPRSPASRSPVNSATNVTVITPTSSGANQYQPVYVAPLPLVASPSPPTQPYQQQSLPPTITVQQPPVYQLPTAYFVPAAAAPLNPYQHSSALIPVTHTSNQNQTANGTFADFSKLQSQQGSLLPAPPSSPVRST